MCAEGRRQRASRKLRGWVGSARVRRRLESCVWCASRYGGIELAEYLGGLENTNGFFL